MQKIDVIEFLKLADNIPVIDVRSPSEFASGHIPQAINIPLFSDEERAIVGTLYKKSGREKAILKGIELTGPAMAGKLSEALKYGKGGKLLVHCWRGGMRSEAMAWLFSLGDIEIFVLEGGYKAYRNHILDALSEKRRMIILGGMTGSSKTYILRHLKQTGCQVIDLEGLACHKGSAFGALGEDPQPTTEHFANLLYDEWRKLDKNAPVWLEDESRNIGTVFMPESFYANMQASKTIVLMMTIQQRLPRLLNEYSKFESKMLSESVMKISKRLGGDNTKAALESISDGDFSKAIEITLQYYDKTYLHGISKKEKENVITIVAVDDNFENNAQKILEAADEIKW